MCGEEEATRGEGMRLPADMEAAKREIAERHAKQEDRPCS